MRKDEGSRLITKLKEEQVKLSEKEFVDKDDIKIKAFRLQSEVFFHYYYLGKGSFGNSNDNLAINSVIEFGAAYGLNLWIIKLLAPECITVGVENDKNAKRFLDDAEFCDRTIAGSVISANVKNQYDYVIVSDFLIHLDSEERNIAYDRLHSVTKKYLFICDYYDKRIESEDYYNKLLSTDCAIEMMGRYEDLKLIDRNYDNSKKSDDRPGYIK